MCFSPLHSSSRLTGHFQDHAVPESGCLWYVKGSSTSGEIRPHEKSNVLGFSQQIVGYPYEGDLEREVAMEALPGDLVIHDSKMIHRANANSTKGPRRAIGAIFYSEDARVSASYHEKQKAIFEANRKAGRL